MPVATHSQSGVARVRIGSLMTTAGCRRASRTPRLTRLASLVVPPAGVYSAADNVVGIAMWGSARPGSRGAMARSQIELAALQCHVAPIEDRGDCDLAGIDRAAAAEADHRIGIAPAQFIGECTHR